MIITIISTLRSSAISYCVQNKFSVSYLHNFWLGQSPLALSIRRENFNIVNVRAL